MYFPREWIFHFFIKIKCNQQRKIKNIQEKKVKLYTKSSKIKQK